MKKSILVKKSAVVILMLSLMLLILTGCDKKSVTTDEFKTLASENGLTCVDAIEQFASYDFIKEATIAVPSDSSYQIEFYVLSDSSYAKSFFETNKTNFVKGETDIDSLKEGGNYSRYSLNSSGKYMFVEYINNTVIYVNTDESNQEAIDTFIKDLKY